jgi:hypothetical protein
MIMLRYECIMPDCLNKGNVMCSENLIPIRIKCAKCNSDMYVYQTNETDVQKEKREEEEFRNWRVPSL